MPTFQYEAMDNTGREVKDTIRTVMSAVREQQAARGVVERLRAQAQIRRISMREAERLASERKAG